MRHWTMCVRLVLDTNILISGLISPASGKPPGLLLDAAREERIVIVTSLDQLAEFDDVIARPHLQKYLRPGVVEGFRELIDALTLIVAGPLPVVIESPDPKDNMILATALAGDAKLIVSGDKRHVLSPSLK
jgi:uncharacterized protein